MTPVQRVAIVTGAASGIGRAIALQLAADGIDVAVCDLSGTKTQEVADEIRKEGRRALVVDVDVTDEAQVALMVNKVVNELGGVDIMIANAGILRQGDILFETLEGFEHVLHINTRGVFLCYKYGAKQMVAQGRGGRIIGASSAEGIEALNGSNLVAYSASKFAVRGITQSSAARLAVYGITVNAYAPGVIDTPMTRVEGLADTVRAAVAATPIGRIGKPEDVAGLVSYLVSDKASFVTGQTLGINGGLLFT